LPLPHKQSKARHVHGYTSYCTHTLCHTTKVVLDVYTSKCNSSGVKLPISLQGVPTTSLAFPPPRLKYQNTPIFTITTTTVQLLLPCDLPSTHTPTHQSSTHTYEPSTTCHTMTPCHHTTFIGQNTTLTMAAVTRPRHGITR
jgi:hypothetical protein